LNPPVGGQLAPVTIGIQSPPAGRQVRWSTPVESVLLQKRLYATFILLSSPPRLEVAAKDFITKIKKAPVFQRRLLKAL